MDKIKKIDIHAHAQPFQQYSVKSLLTNQTWVSPEQVIDFYDEVNVEKGVLLTIVSPEYQYEQISNNECKLTVDKYPDRFVWFCGLDPKMAENTGDAKKLSHIIEHYKSLGAKGVGELIAQHYVDDTLMDNLFACCSEYDMPVTIHIAPKKGGYYGIIDDLNLPRLEKVLKKHKNLKILGHSQCFWSEISADNTNEIRGGYPKGKVIDGTIARLMRECPNLYCDCSAGSGLNALSRDRDYGARFMEEFSDRALYGLDICSPNNTHQYRHEKFLEEMLDGGYLSEENYYKYVRGNAVKLLKLED
jgi:predicted TIM-barrel fold metal-dependent hydrolase